MSDLQSDTPKNAVKSLLDDPDLWHTEEGVTGKAELAPSPDDHLSKKKLRERYKAAIDGMSEEQIALFERAVSSDFKLAQIFGLGVRKPGRPSILPEGDDGVAVNIQFFEAEHRAVVDQASRSNKPKAAFIREIMNHAARSYERGDTAVIPDRLRKPPSSTSKDRGVTVKFATEDFHRIQRVAETLNVSPAVLLYSTALQGISVK